MQWATPGSVSSAVNFHAGGAAIGLGFGIAMRYILRWMRHGGAGIEQQVALTFAVGYLSYYTANAPANFSGARWYLAVLKTLATHAHMKNNQTAEAFL